MKTRLRSERGAELIEFALIFPLLLLLMLGIVDFGFMFQRYEVLTNATREGARVAVLPGYANADASLRVCTYLASGGVPTTGCGTTNPVVTVTDTTVAMAVGPALQVKRVQVTYTHNYMFVGPIISLIGGGTFSTAVPITTVAVMRKEI
jgi:Flp pilus assembly protein TadG